MSYTPNQNKKSAYACALAFFFCAFIALFAAPHSSVKIALQLLCLGCATGGIFVLARYGLQTFVYFLDDAQSEENDLTVQRLQGKKRTTVCRLSFSLGVGLEKKDGQTDEKKYGKITSRHNYTASLTPASVYMLYFLEENELRLILLECDDVFAAHIRRRLPPGAGGAGNE